MSNQLNINVRMLLKYFIGLFIVHNRFKEDFAFFKEISHGPIKLEFLSESQTQYGLFESAFFLVKYLLILCESLLDLPTQHVRLC
jgi:hypothetical protein